MTNTTTKVKKTTWSWWLKVKKWFKHSETIFLARLYAVIGVVTTFIGSMDFAPLWSTLKTGTWLSQKEVIAIGLGILGSGIMFEIARRRNANLK